MDTSALVKLYVVEEGREVVEQAVEEAGVISTSVVAYAEARAALARKRREGVFSAEEHQEAVDALNEAGSSPAERAAEISTDVGFSFLPARCILSSR